MNDGQAFREPNLGLDVVVSLQDLLHLFLDGGRGSAALAVAVVGVRTCRRLSLCTALTSLLPRLLVPFLLFLGPDKRKLLFAPREHERVVKQFLLRLLRRRQPGLGGFQVSTRLDPRRTVLAHGLFLRL